MVGLMRVILKPLKGLNELNYIPSVHWDQIWGNAFTDSLQFIASKTKAALDGGLGVILCIGETLEVGLFSPLRLLFRTALIPFSC